MKKFLALLLSVLMLFSCLSVGSMAADGTAPVAVNDYSAYWKKNGGPTDETKQVLMVFEIGNGTLKNTYTVYDPATGKYTNQANLTGTFVKVPSGQFDMRPGDQVLLPAVNGYGNYNFNSWTCSLDGMPYQGGGAYEIPEGTTAGIVITFTANYLLQQPTNPGSAYNQWFEGSNPVADKATQTVLSFDINGGALMNGAYVYDTTTGAFVYTEGITGMYYMLPQNQEAQRPGYYITLPYVQAPTNSQFTGWYCYADGKTYSPGSSWQIPAGSAGTIIEFRAFYAPASVEEDTITKVMNILIKVFGAIIGIVLYSGDTEAGVALMQKVLGGIF